MTTQQQAREIMATFLAESRRAETEGRSPHTITITQAERDALMEYVGHWVEDVPRSGEEHIFGVPLQVLEEARRG